MQRWTIARLTSILLLTVMAWLGPGATARSGAACGSAWSVELPPNPSSSLGRFAGVTAVSDAETWAVGDYTVDETSRGQTLAEHWDGTAWTITPTPVGQFFSTLSGVAAVSSTDAWAVGWRDSLGLILHWDGNGWTEVEGPDTGSLSSLSSVTALSSDDVWAVGQYVPRSGDVFQALALHWNGSEWSLVPTPSLGDKRTQFLSVSANATGDVWAVGMSVDANGRSRTVTEHWDGVGWTIVPSPNPPHSFSRLTAVVTVAPGRAVAVGWYVGTDPKPNAIALDWDGVAWQNLPLGLSDNTVVNGATAAGGVVAVGGHNQKTMAFRVNGGARILPTPNPGTFDVLLAASSTSTGQVVAAGSETVGTTTNPLIERRCD